MRRRAALLLLAVTVTVAGCGGGRRPATELDLPGPTAVKDLATECGLPPSTGARAAELPRVLLPPRSYVVAEEGTSFGYRATVVIGLSVTQALESVVRQARRERYKVLRTENEGFDAEAFLERGKVRTAVRLFASRFCEDASQAVFTGVSG